MKSDGSQFSAKEASYARRHVRSLCELIEGAEDCSCMTSTSEGLAVDANEQVNLVEKFWDHEMAGDLASVKGILAKNGSFRRDIVQASPYILDVIHCGFGRPFQEEPTDFFTQTKPQFCQWLILSAKLLMSY